MFSLRRLLFALFLLGAGGAWAASLAPVQVERAQYLENTMGDLEGAIAAYAGVADDLKNPRRWRAEATFGLASCHDKMESYVIANRYYLEVVKKFGEFKGLADRAGEEILAISRVLAQDGGAVSDDDLIGLSDMALALDAFIENDEFAAAAEVCAALRGLLVRLVKEVVGTPDEEAFEVLSREVESMSALLEEGDGQKVRKFLERSEELVFYVDSFFPELPGEVYTPVLRWKDRVARALAKNDAAAVAKFSKRITDYLVPLLDLPDKEEMAFAKSLHDQLATIAAQVEAGDWLAARKSLFDGDRERWETMGMTTVQLIGNEELPLPLLGQLNFIHSWMERGAEVAADDPVAARAAFDKVLASSRNLEHLEGAGFVEVIEEMIAAIDAGRAEDVLKIYEGGDE